MAKESNSEEKQKTSGLFLKIKGAAKLGFGVFCIFNPHIAFGIGAVGCAGIIAGKVVSNIQGRPLKQMWNDLFDGTFTRNLKNISGMSFGAAVGLFAPYVGIALAAAGSLSFLIKNPAGIEGLFQGGAIATAVGTVGLPVVGAAFCIDGIANSLGYEPNIIERSVSLVKGMFSSLGRVTKTAEQNIDAPEKAVVQVLEEVKNAKENTKGVVQEVEKVAKDTKDKAKETIDKGKKEFEEKNPSPENQEPKATSNKKSFVERFKDGVSSRLGGRGVE